MSEGKWSSTGVCTFQTLKLFPIWENALQAPWNAGTYVILVVKVSTCMPSAKRLLTRSMTEAQIDASRVSIRSRFYERSSDYEDGEHIEFYSTHIESCACFLIPIETNVLIFMIAGQWLRQKDYTIWMDGVHGRIGNANVLFLTFAHYVPPPCLNKYFCSEKTKMMAGCWRPIAQTSIPADLQYHCSKNRTTYPSFLTWVLQT